ncbi:MAG: DinB family protein [Sphingobacteriales bacterium]|nr:DinB family protein [Sphingobacteriales bacterium]
MKEYLIETFRYNDSTNRKLLSKILQLPDRTEAVRLFSHLINSQYKWMARISKDPAAPQLSWWDPVYAENELEREWARSLDAWLLYISSKTEDELNTEVRFVGYDNGQWAATPKDIALQLNYHSIHHRAQIQTLLRQQGIEPDFVDYIGTKYRRISD